MAKKIDPVLIEILTKYGEKAEDALWDCHGTWVALHRAIERIAAKAGITFDMPEIIEARSADKTAVIVVRGFLDEKAEWSFGEAQPANNKNAYPFAMAEKRAKDRVVLKLIGLHGLVYSEEESDDFKPRAANDRSDQETPVKPSKDVAARATFTRLTNDMRSLKTKEALREWWQNHETISAKNTLPSDWQANLRTEFVELGTKAPSNAEQFKSDVNEQFPDKEEAA